MPILKSTELSGYIGANHAHLITRDANAFTLAEQAVSDIINRETGLAIPDDADSAPKWAKEAAAYLILHRRIGTVVNPSPGLLSWAREMHGQAMETLAQHKEAIPTGRTGAESGELEGVLKW